MHIRGIDGARRTNGYLLFARPAVNRPIRIEYPLCSAEITLKHRTRDIRARLRGDAVIAMDSFGQDLTYFDPLE